MGDLVASGGLDLKQATEQVDATTRGTTPEAVLRDHSRVETTGWLIGRQASRSGGALECASGSRSLLCGSLVGPTRSLGGVRRGDPHPRGGHRHRERLASGRGRYQPSHVNISGRRVSGVLVVPLLCAYQLGHVGAPDRHGDGHDARVSPFDVGRTTSSGPSNAAPSPAPQRRGRRTPAPRRRTTRTPAPAARSTARRRPRPSRTSTAPRTITAFTRRSRPVSSTTTEPLRPGCATTTYNTMGPSAAVTFTFDATQRDAESK